MLPQKRHRPYRAKYQRVKKIAHTAPNFTSKVPWHGIHQYQLLCTFLHKFLSSEVQWIRPLFLRAHHLNLRLPFQPQVVLRPDHPHLSIISSTFQISILLLIQCNVASFHPASCHIAICDVCAFVLAVRVAVCLSTTNLVTFACNSPIVQFPWKSQWRSLFVCLFVYLCRCRVRCKKRCGGRRHFSSSKHTCFCSYEIGTVDVSFSDERLSFVLSWLAGESSVWQLAMLSSLAVIREIDWLTTWIM